MGGEDKGPVERWVVGVPVWLGRGYVELVASDTMV